MVALIDTNVLMNFLLGRDDPQLDSSLETVRRCVLNEFKGVIAFHTLSTIWYAERRCTEDMRRNDLRTICRIFTVAAATHKAVESAVENSGFRDFEDCLQYICAETAEAYCIVTCNTRDFSVSPIPAVTPSEFIALLDSSGQSRL